MQDFGSTVKAPIFAISRLRMGTDGKGITTLVAFMGCPLNCKYCLNPQCHEPVYETDGTTLRKNIMMLTPQNLYELVKVDNPYFLDIKTMDPLTYEQYTGKTSGVLQQLSLLQMNIPQEKVTIKVPQIPGFTDGRDLDLDIKDIERRFNFTDIIKARYRTNNR